MDEKISQYFGLIIAFLIPGMTGLYAAAYFAPAVQEWFGTAAAKETTVGGFLFVIVASVGMGVFISGLRWYLLEHVATVFPTPPVLEHESRKEEQKDRAYQDARAQHYMYFLFYGNMLVALPLLFVAWFVGAQPRPRWFSDILPRFVLLVVSSWVLFRSACDAIGRFKVKAIRILGTVPPAHDRVS